MSDIVSLDEYRARRTAREAQEHRPKRYPVALRFTAAGAHVQAVLRRDGKRITFAMELPVARLLLGDLAKAIEQAQEK